MRTSAQPLHELPEPGKMDHRLLAVLAKSKMPNVGSLRNGCTTTGISRPSQRDMPTDVARYATVGEVDAES
jgi:hypothetical protein